MLKINKEVYTSFTIHNYSTLTAGSSVGLRLLREKFPGWCLCKIHAEFPNAVALSSLSTGSSLLLLNALSKNSRSQTNFNLDIISHSC